MSASVDGAQRGELGARLDFYFPAASTSPTDPISYSPSSIELGRLREIAAGEGDAPSEREAAWVITFLADSDGIPT
jgi:hypothetical protein